MKHTNNIIKIVFALLFISLGACQKSVESIEDMKARENDEAIQAYLSKNNITATKTSVGVYYVITKKNDAGKTPAVGDLITYHYKTKRLDGVGLDSTSTINNKPGYSPFGTINNIWGQVASVLKEGEKGTFFLPYNFAYGVKSTANLPGYSPVQMEFSLEKLRNEEEQINSYIADNKLITTKTSTGLHFEITKAVPAGEVLKTGQTIKVKYTGKLLYFSNNVDINNKITNTFDSGEFEIVLGSGKTIKGFEEGIAKLKVGEKGNLIFPSTLGYGDVGSSKDANGNQKILPKSPLLFEIEVISAK
jgi:FKBP-type peptidyl-prolyl cis-trans isomerase